jgi:hypothetical protein
LVRQTSEILRYAACFIECEKVGLMPRTGIIAAIEICEWSAVGVLNTETTRNFDGGPGLGKAGIRHLISMI